MQVIIENSEVSVCALDRPVCHVLPGDMQTITLKFLLLAVKRDGIDILCVHHCRLKGRGHKASS